MIGTGSFVQSPEFKPNSRQNARVKVSTLANPASNAAGLGVVGDVGFQYGGSVVVHLTDDTG